MAFLNTVAEMFRGVLLNWLNMGIMLGLTFGVLILLRPLTNHILKPTYRMILWGLGWMTWIGFTYDRMGDIKFLPVTFRSLVIPRTQDDIGLGSNKPAFIPAELEAGVEYTVALPGGAEIPFALGQTAITALSLLGLAAFILVVVWLLSGSGRLKKRFDPGRLLTREELSALGVEDTAAVRVCPGLPTSFVAYGRDKEADSRYTIYLQEELPPARRKLVLQHELQHIYHGHVWMKLYLTLALMLFWWNPILWVAHRLTCRDMELSCDEAVLSKLSAEERKEYAKTLVELGSGKFLWGAMTSFGECDAAIRVKQAVAWKKEPEIMDGLRILLVIAMGLFFYTGALNWAPKSYDPAENLVEAAESWDGDNTQWREYAAGPKLIDDLREFMDRPALKPFSLYELREGETYIYTYLGEWFRCEFARDGDGVWQPTAFERLMKQDVDTEGLNDIKPWTRTQ